MTALARTMRVSVIRTTGAEEEHQVPRGSVRAIQALIGCNAFDVVNLRDGRVMLVDDDGWETEPIERAPPNDRVSFAIEMRPTTPRKPINEKATAIYRSVTLPNEHRIVGDVAIVRDEDFA